MPKVSEAHIEARKNQILDAATTCFARHGIRETTIQRICTEANLSAGAVYRYFGSKREILQAVYARSMEQNRGFGQQLAGSEDALEELRKLITQMVRFVGEPSLTQAHHLSIRVHAASLSDPELAESYVALHRDAVSQITPLVQKMVDEGRVSGDLDPEYFMWVIITIYQGLRVQKMLDPQIDLDRFTQTLLRMFDATLKP